MSKFKRGDRVVALETIGRLVFGRKYIVHDVLSNGAVLSIVGDPILYSSDRFDLVKSEFNMKTQPWFIRVNNEEEWKLAVDFAKSNGVEYIGTPTYYESTSLITNITSGGRITGNLMHGTVCGTDNEIKLSYKKVIDKVEYPEVKSEQQLEIEKIEEEMRKLADRLNSLKSQ